MPDLFVADHTQEKKGTSHRSAEPSAHPAKAPTVKRGGVGFFTSFHPDPGGVSFENQEQHEEIRLFVRRHFITNLRWIATVVILLFVPVFFPTIASMMGLAFSFSSFVILGLAFYYLVVIGYAILSFTAWFYNIGIVTDMRVVDIDLYGITNRHIAATGLSDIVDVSYSQKGFFTSFFEYGNVHMQTEGFTPNFEFLSVPKPGKVADIISDLMGA